jgi:hypothetical protein
MFHTAIDHVFHVYCATSHGWKEQPLLICVDNRSMRRYATHKATHDYDVHGRLTNIEIQPSKDFRCAAILRGFNHIDLFGDGLPNDLSRVALHRLTGDTLTEQEKMFSAAYDAIVHNQPGAARELQEMAAVRYRRNMRGLRWEIFKYRVRRFFGCFCCA